MTGDLIARPELVARLAASTVSIVLAPAGYGKSTLLRGWDATDERAFVWLSARDDATALNDTATAPAPPSPRVVIVDDVDRASSAQAAFSRAVAALVAQPGTTLVLAGRSIDAALAVRLRLDHDVCELDEEDLGFDDGEAATLLGTRCDAPSAAMLADRTRGWPAALRLAALALDRGLARAELFSGRDRLVEEYLQTAVFADVDEDTMAFLRACSVFDALERALCDHALERRDSDAMLAELEASHLFVRSRDRERERFTIHPLVREALRAQLDRADPTAAPRVRARGADWYAGAGRSQEALVLRLVDGDPAGAAELLADVVLPMFSAGQLLPLTALIHRIGPDVALRNGFLATMFSYAGVMTGDIVCARRWCSEAQRIYAAHRFATADEEVVYFTLRAHLAPDGFAVMADDAKHALEVADEASPWRVPALMLVGISALLRGDTRRALSRLDEAMHRSSETAIRPALVLTLAERAAIAEGDGRADAMRVDLERAVDAIGDDMHDYPHCALVWALLALRRQQDGDPSGARSAYQAADALRPVAGRTMPWLGAQVRAVLARAAVGFGDLPAARALAAEADQLLIGWPAPAGLRRELDGVARALRALPDSGTTRPLLTAAELRVLPLLSSHLSYEEIGAQLHLSRNTVKSQVLATYRKLGVSSRSDAVVHARELGLIAR